VPARSWRGPALIAALAVVPAAVAVGALWRGRAASERLASTEVAATSVRPAAASAAAPAPPPAPAPSTAAAPADTGSEQTVTAVAPGRAGDRPDFAGRPVGRPPVGPRRAVVARPAAKVAEGGGTRAHAPQPTVVAPAFDLENPYK
jgi:hypothetical protein